MTVRPFSSPNLPADPNRARILEGRVIGEMPESENVETPS